MKIGIIGTGSVGKSCALATVMRGCANELILVDKNFELAQAVAVDMQYGAVLSPRINIHAGDYAELQQADLIMITAGVNEKSGGATDRNDPQGRLKLLNVNAEIFKEIIPKAVKSAPEAVLMIVTDPPDPLADVARQLAGHNRVISTGTYLDTLRFRFHIARQFKVNPIDVNAFVLGEHGTSSVFLWSSVMIGGAPLSDLLAKNTTQYKQQIEKEVKYANITIIEGNNASQYGIGMVCARIAEIVLRDEQAVIPIGSYQAQYGVTFSLPSIAGRQGIKEVLVPAMSAEEEQALQDGAKILRKALQL